MSFNLGEVAAMLGTTIDTIRRCCDGCDEPMPRVGPRRVIPADRLDDVARQLKQRRTHWTKRDRLGAAAA